MDITIKTLEDIEKLREGGRRLARVVAAVAERVKPGVNAAELDEFADS
jgi:methionine aminopeptidase